MQTFWCDVLSNDTITSAQHCRLGLLASLGQHCQKNWHQRGPNWSSLAPEGGVSMLVVPCPR